MAALTAAFAAVAVAGCSSDDSDGSHKASDAKTGTSSPAPTAAPTTPAAPKPVLTEAEARQILENYDRENNAANEANDAARLAKVEGAPLLDDSNATYRTNKLRTDLEKYQPFSFVAPVFWIPLDTGYPRTFNATSVSKLGDTAGNTRYFVQEKPGDPWKVVFSQYVRLIPDAKGATPPKDSATMPLLGDIATDPTGAAKLADPADPARSVCAEYASWMTVGPTSGGGANPRFAPGSFSTELAVELKKNATGDPNLMWATEVKARDLKLPLYELASGDRLVPCAFDETVNMAVARPDATLSLGNKAAAAIIGRKDNLKSVQMKTIAFALIAVPAQPGAPATVLGSNVDAPTVVEATGT